MPSAQTELTELTTALGMLPGELAVHMAHRPTQLRNVPDGAWERLVETYRSGEHQVQMQTAFENGRVFLYAVEGLRGRHPLAIEWKGPQRPPGDDVIPADLRADHVYLVSCKYLSKVLVNPGPPRLFDRLLVGDERSIINWFAETAGAEFQALYEAVIGYGGIRGLPDFVTDLDKTQQRTLKAVFPRHSSWPSELRPSWAALCAAVAQTSADRWRAAMGDRDQRQLLWRLLRITTAAYFVLGTQRNDHLRFRIDSSWDWLQHYEMRSFQVAARSAGQPEVAWTAVVRRRSDGLDQTINGHVEIRWSHGRFVGSPEAKVYLDTDYALVPGYHRLS